MNQLPVILIVDDSPVGSAVLADMLRDQGYLLVFAGSGEAALDKVAALLPDLILLDVMLPGMDGFEVCRRLRATPRLAEVPIILVTALDDRISRLKGLDAGADDFMTKPYDQIELRARVRAITRLNRYRRLLAERNAFERVIEHLPNGMLIVDRAGIIQLVNPTLLWMVGAEDAAQLVGTSMRALVAPDQFACYSLCVDGVFADFLEVSRAEVAFVHCNGSHVPVELDIGHFTWNDESSAQIIAHDMSERKQAEVQIQHQLRQLIALRTINMANSVDLDVRAVLNVVLEQTIAQLNVDAADVFLVEPTSQLLHYVAGRGFPTDLLPRIRLPINDGYASPVMRERRTVHISSLADASDPRRTVLLDEAFVSYFGVPLIAKGQLKGVLEIFQRRPCAPDAEWLDFLEMLAGQAALAIDNAMLFDDLQHANMELTLAYDSMIEAWSKMLNLRDREAEGHTQRVVDLTLRLARAVGMSATELAHVRRGALLHDIGKLGIPDAVSHKSGPLTADEWVIMRKHPVYTYEWLAPIPFLRPALDIPYCHHEKWDGSGYPRGLQGEQIPLAARIFAVVDAWDIMRSDRPYCASRSKEEVCAEMRALAGTHFDPQIVELFLEMMP